jgi:GTPase SAR1 family protein
MPESASTAIYALGLGGSGKTQICLKYVQGERDRYVQFSSQSTAIDQRRYSGTGVCSGLMQVQMSLAQGYLPNDSLST